MRQFWVQVEGASFDCSAMLLRSAQTGGMKVIPLAVVGGCGKWGTRHAFLKLAMTQGSKRLPTGHQVVTWTDRVTGRVCL